MAVGSLAGLEIADWLIALVVAALTAATLTPGALRLVRVLRHDAWLAVSRLALVQPDMTPPSGAGRRQRLSE